jgi:hypothetical protein
MPRGISHKISRQFQQRHQQSDESINKARQGMNILDDFVKRQKEGATFVISAQMLRLTPEEFDTVAQIWADEGGPGFNVVGVPHRTVQDGEFFISRVTVIKTTPRLPATQG